MLEIVATLQRSSVVDHVQVIDFIDEATVKYLKCRADLIDGSMLFINESSIAGHNKYSYHWQDSRNQLRVRWDNAPPIITSLLSLTIAMKAVPYMKILV